MSLICIACSNREFFESDVETVMELALSEQNLLVQPAVMEDWKYAEESIRDQLNEDVLSTLKMHADELRKDYPNDDFINPYLKCAVCFSGSVCRPLSDWQPRQPVIDLDDEIFNNRHNLTELRKVRKTNENILPVLWKPL